MRNGRGKERLNRQAEAAAEDLKRRAYLKRSGREEPRSAAGK